MNEVYYMYIVCIKCICIMNEVYYMYIVYTCICVYMYICIYIYVYIHVLNVYAS